MSFSAAGPGCSSFPHVPVLCAIDHRSGYRRSYLVGGKGPYDGSALLWQLGVAAPGSELLVFLGVSIVAAVLAVATPLLAGEVIDTITTDSRGSSDVVVGLSLVAAVISYVAGIGAARILGASSLSWGETAMRPWYPGGWNLPTAPLR